MSIPEDFFTPGDTGEALRRELHTYLAADVAPTGDVLWDGAARIERRIVCAKCRQIGGGTHKHCLGGFVEEIRYVTPWQRRPEYANAQ